MLLRYRNQMQQRTFGVGALEPGDYEIEFVKELAKSTARVVLRKTLGGARWRIDASSRSHQFPFVARPVTAATATTTRRRSRRGVGVESVQPKNRSMMKRRPKVQQENKVAQQEP